MRTSGEVGENGVEAEKRLARVAMENATLSKSLKVKERLVEELHRHVLQIEAEANAFKLRFDSLEKENGYLKKEFSLLVKEMEVQNVELEYYRRSVDASHMQHLQNLQKIGKLDAECQRLQRMTRKKQFGSVPFAKVSSGVAGGGRERGKSSSAFPHECLSSCLEKLRAVEEENNVLKGLLEQKIAEVEAMGEAHGTGMKGNRKNMELVGYESVMESDLCSDSCSVSWANALITELDHFKGEKMRNEVKEVANMSLMDDFVEVEKLAMISCQESSNGEENHLAVVLHQDGADKEEPFDWLQIVMNAVKKEQNISQRSVPELVEDMRIALGCFHQTNVEEEAPSIEEFTLSRIVKLVGKLEEISEMENGISLQEDYRICAFQWKISELNSAVKQLGDGFSGLRSGKFNIRNFVEWFMDCLMSPSDLETSFNLHFENQKDNQIKEFKELFENQLKNQKLVNEELSSQLVCAQVELKETVQKLLSMEIELDDKNNKYEELEAECLDLQLVLESIQQKPENHDLGDTEKQPKQAQEDLLPSTDTITGGKETFNEVVGKELSTLVEESKLEKNATSNRSYTKRFSLREQIIAEDTGKAIILRAQSGHARTSSFRDTNAGQLLLVRSPYPYIDPKNTNREAVIGALVVPKKEGFSLLKKLIVRKKSSSKARGGR